MNVNGNRFTPNSILLLVTIRTHALAALVLVDLRLATFFKRSHRVEVNLIGKKERGKSQVKKAGRVQRKKLFIREFIFTFGSLLKKWEQPPGTIP